MKGMLPQKKKKKKIEKKKDPEEEEIAYLKKDIDLELQAKKEVQWNNDELERRSEGKLSLFINKNWASFTVLPIWETFIGQVSHGQVSVGQLL